MKKYQFHPVANIFPLVNQGPEFEAFVASIKGIGLQQPIVLHEGKVLDGRRRCLACHKAGVEPQFMAWDGNGSPVDYVISVNALRRHLTASQLAVAAIKALPFYQKEAKDRQRLSKGRGNKGAQSCATIKGKAADWAAKKVGISVRTVEMAKKVQDARPKLIVEIEAGRKTVNEAYEAVAHKSDALKVSHDTSLDDRFRTPPWLFKVLDDDYHFCLDACAEPEVALCKDYYSPKQDALRQDWARYRSVFCNPPYNWHQLEEWVVKGFLESQKGATVVMVLPYFKSYAWFRYVVVPFAEIRQIQGQVVYQGYGSQKDNCAGNKGSRTFDSLVAIFRKRQRGFNGQYVDRPGKPPPEFPKSLPKEFCGGNMVTQGGVAKRRKAA